MSIRHTVNLHTHRGNRILTEPTVEPVTLGELKEHMRLEGSTDDQYLLDLLAEARQMIEDYIGMAMIDQSWTLTFDRWPRGQEPWWDGVRQGHINVINASAHLVDIAIPRWPLQSITSIKVFDEDSNETTVTVANVFDIDTTQLPGRISLQRGGVWPIASRANKAIEIVYVAGYGSTSVDVPNPVKRAIKQIVALLYTHRGDCGGAEDVLKKSGAMSIVNKYKVDRI